MKWDKVEVKTEQVVDENPQTWFESAQEDFNAGNYDSALGKLQQARAFSNNDPGISCLTYAQEVFAYLAQDNKLAARESSRLLRELGNSVKLPNGLSAFESLVIKNPILAHVCMDINPYDDFWYKTWLASVDDVIKEQDFDLIEDILAYEDIYSFTEKTLAEHATNDFAFAVVQHSKLNLLQALHRGGFNLRACKRRDGRNLLMTAVTANSSSEIFDFLIINKINDIDAKDNYGRTALMHWANSAQYTPKNFELLINAGTNVNATNNAKQTALMIATKQNDAHKIRLLIDSGAKVSLRDSNNNEAISYADDKECLKILINAGANVNATTRHSQLGCVHTIELRKINE